MCKISVTESFTEERVLWEGIIKRSDLVWAEVGFWTGVSEHWRMRSGERVLDERSCDRRAEIWVFKCQIHCDSSLGVQEYIPGTCISTSTSGNPFPPQTFIEHGSGPETLPGAENSVIFFLINFSAFWFRGMISPKATQSMVFRASFRPAILRSSPTPGGPQSTAANSVIYVKSLLLSWSLFLMNLIQEIHRPWAHLEKIWLKRC